MFPIAIYSAAQIPDFTWQATEVVREVDHKPHLLVRVSVRGGFFPHRALVPVMRIVRGDQFVRAWFTEISEDNGTLNGYFATDLPDEGIIEFGYPDGPPGRVRAVFSSRDVKRLVREKLGADVVVVKQTDVDAKRRR